VVSRESGHVFIFYAPEPIFGGTEGVRSRFHILRSQTHVDSTEGIVSRFNVLHSMTRFWRYRRNRVQFSCYALPDTFSACPRAWGPVFLFCAPRLIFGGTEGVVSRFHVLRSRTRFQRYRWRRVPFLFFANLDPFSAVPRASGPVFMFCAPGLIFSGTEGVGSRFLVLRSRTHFRRYHGCKVSFSTV
jgi:hypothetical protein